MTKDIKGRKIDKPLSDRTESAENSQPRVGGVFALVPDISALQRLPNESEQAYEAWMLYVDIKSKNEGGVVEVGRRLGKSKTLMERWSSRHGWKERLRLMQNQQQMLQEREQRKALRKASDEWAKRKINIREEGFSVGQMLIERGKRLLQLPSFTREVRATVKAASGEDIETLTVLNFIEHPKDARQFIEAGLKMMRMSADMSTENVSIIDDDLDLDSLNDEQLEAYAQRLVELKRKMAQDGKI